MSTEHETIKTEPTHELYESCDKCFYADLDLALCRAMACKHAFNIIKECFKPREVKPPAIEPTRWTPCSERLPEEECRHYLVTEMLKEGHCLCILYYSNDESNQDFWNRHVLAWMPLPEPWKGEEG